MWSKSQPQSGLNARRARFGITPVERDQADAQRQAIAGVGQILDPQRIHHEIAETHQHPRCQRQPEQPILLQAPPGSQRMRSLEDLERTRWVASEQDCGRGERQGEDQQQPRELVQPPGKEPSRDMTEQGGAGDADHDRPRKEPAARVGRVIIVVDLGQQGHPG